MQPLSAGLRPRTFTASKSVKCIHHRSLMLCVGCLTHGELQEQCYFSKRNAKLVSFTKHCTFGCRCQRSVPATALHTSAARMKGKASSKDQTASCVPTRDVHHCHHRSPKRWPWTPSNQQQMSQCRKTLQGAQKWLRPGRGEGISATTLLLSCFLSCCRSQVNWGR